ncbi:hypothetical protein [Nocardioides sp. SYSU D00038]|uniref:acyltransferase n=1 Tax=Nocardioides sp. SYSU D00038 TaxID=2812554 RepID=UPI0019670BEE|nr:hypothetical protein [Nocardioides sp. SYSU D00038]
MRYVFATFLVLLPSGLKRRMAKLLLGWDIHPTAHIGRSIVLARHVSMGPGALIGSRNVIRGLDELRMAEGASIASRNFINGLPPGHWAFPKSPDRTSTLVMGKESLITVGHEIDCSDKVVLEDYARVAGFRSQILTHSLNLVTNEQTTGPVTIGELSALMSGVIVMSGCDVPPRCIVSAGSVITTRLKAELTLYRGNPATAARPLPATLGYFTRVDEHPPEL